MLKSNKQLSPKEQVKVGLKTSLAGVTTLLAYASLFLTVPIGYYFLTDYSDSNNNTSVHSLIHSLVHSFLFIRTANWDSFIWFLYFIGMAFILGFFLIALLLLIFVPFSALKISNSFKTKASKYNSYILKIILVINTACFALFIFQVVLGIFK